MICQRIRVSGLVQGVGFRPFVWRLAKELELTGWVRNDAHGVDIEVYGLPAQISAFTHRLQHEAPEKVRIDALLVRDGTLQCQAADFYILNSRGGRAGLMSGHDTAVCHACLKEMFDPERRRWRYAFTHCAHCGPRYSVSRALPYQRERTSLKPFALCARCQNEQHRHDSRHHQNEALCCPKCGPQLSLLDAQGQPLDGDPVERALALLKQGRILALKSQGGFHLVCDARNAAAVALLRSRRGGDRKPLPVMFANATSASACVQLGVGEPGLLAMPERPVILLKKRCSCDAALPEVSAGLPWLGVMLPCTPLQYLLFHEAAGRPAGTAWLEQAQDTALIMTAAAADDELPPGANEEALKRLAGIADAFLCHDQEIVALCVDSIARAGPGGLQFVRRSRGYAPRPFKLPRSGPPVLAVGGRFNNTVCVTRGDEAFVSPHLGDGDGAADSAYFAETIGRLLKFLEVKPALVVHDPEPGIPATKFALDYAQLKGVPALAVPHQHAHVAAILAEHQIDQAVVALSLDGPGAGPGGRGRGGELLRVEGVSLARLGQLAPIQLTRETGARQPWQSAAAVLLELGRGVEIGTRFQDQGEAEGLVRRLAHAQPETVETPSMSCYVNAAAGLLGVCSSQDFEGQAAMLLEGLAEQHGEVAAIDGGWRIENGCLNLLPLFAVLADEKNAGRGAALFHATLVAALAEWVAALAPNARSIVASGACFLDLVLARGLRASLNARGVQLIEARRMPPNDGGLALGQAWLALQYLLGEPHPDSGAV
jgi:hydrogenase maturation protein HypF